MRLNKFYGSFLMLSAILLSLMGHAQQVAAGTAVPAASTTSTGTTLMYLLVAVSMMLLIAIIVLSQVFIRLTIYVYQNKNKIAKAALLLLLICSGATVFAQGTAPAATAAPSPPNPYYSTNFLVAFTALLSEVVVVFVLLYRILGLLRQISPVAEVEASTAKKFELPQWFDRFNESVAIEREADIMLDHNYDGIRELDNQLPPWWKWGFVLTIFWSFGYLAYYHVMAAAPLSAVEYTNEMEAAKLAKEAYMRTAKNNVDENTVVFDASYIDEGHNIFTANCVACHGAKGEGNVGPNLTDGFWLHGGKINDIFKTIKYGWPANGMKSWQSDLSAMQIAQVASYVKSLKGTNPPNPKAPQGEPEEGGAKADSTMATAAAPAMRDSSAR